MALKFIGWRFVSTVTVAAAGLLIGCGKSAPPPRQEEVQLSAPAPTERSVIQQEPVKPPAEAEPITMPEPSAERTPFPATSHAESQLRVALAQYAVADRQTRTDI